MARMGRRTSKALNSRRASPAANLTPEQTMKTRLERLIEKITRLRDHAEDDEFRDELDNALIHLDAASDRLVAMDEEEDEES